MWPGRKTIDNEQRRPTGADASSAAPVTSPLAAFSASLTQLVTSVAPLVCAIRIGPNRHITGLVCQGEVIVTADQALPTLDTYTVVLTNRLLVAARPGPRDPHTNIAVLRLDSPWPATNPAVATASVGGVVVVLGADADASPTVRLTVVHRFIRIADWFAPVLDLPGDTIDQGSPVLDPEGGLIGLAAIGPNGEAMVIPSALIGRVLVPNPGRAVSAGAGLTAEPLPGGPPMAGSLPSGPVVAQPVASAAPMRRAWLGVALQPITVPDHLVARAGQASGRMVVSVTKGGPAELAGMRVGDVLLAIDGNSTSGPHALRAFLEGERIGTTVEVRLLRDGAVVTGPLTVAAQPG